jgi:glycosylphosphatidylinositol transamidase (GPIT) subunit GPI8
MQNWIDEAKNKVISISNEIRSKFTTSKLRMSFVGYRDINDVKRFEQFAFTSDIDDLQKFIVTLKAKTADSRADYPEDVFGAFDHVTDLTWESQIRVLIHIADAPCHGNR